MTSDPVFGPDIFGVCRKAKKGCSAERKHQGQNCGVLTRVGYVLVTELNELALMKQGQQGSRIGRLSPGLPGQPLSPLFSTRGLFVYLSPQPLTPMKLRAAGAQGWGFFIFVS